MLVSSPDHQHARLRAILKLPEEFVIHSLRHTMLTRLRESVSRRYVHPLPEFPETAFESLDMLHRFAAGCLGSPHSRQETGSEKCWQVRH
jgi:hypothetical protein